MRKAFFDLKKLSFFIFLIFLIFVVALINITGSVILRSENGKDYLRLLYNTKMYINSYVDEPMEQYKDKIRANVIKELDRLVLIKHIYQPNDNLYSLAKLYGTDVPSIRSSNNIEAVGMLSAGKELILSNKKGLIYKVKDGENIEAIAKKFNKNPTEILLANDKPGLYEPVANEYLLIPNKYLKFPSFWLPKTKITSGFGMRVHPIFAQHRFHEGIDLKMKYGTPVRATSDGKVIFSGWKEGYGNLIIIKHFNLSKDGRTITSYYGHLSKIKVRVGQNVRQGDYIGNVGTTGWTTGPHLHFEIRENGIPQDPVKMVNKYKF